MMPKLSSRINFNYKNKVYYFNCQEVELRHNKSI